ncbi:metallophosphoesterase [Colwellia sp. RE-S-Sl-9]
MKHALKVAQISDTHLFADKNTLHCGANVYQHLVHVLTHIQGVEKPDVIVFTGDLTQDHTDASYQQFVEIFQQLDIQIPVHFIAGNHDEHRQLEQYLTNKSFNSSKIITHNAWQILLINSKSETPSGYVSEGTLNELSKNIDPEKKQLVFMHHHPLDVGYFIDKHGLKNKTEFWNAIQQFPSIQAIACGHVHNDLSIQPEQSGYNIPLYTCPATSIQFDQTANTSACNGQGAGYRIFELSNDGTYTTCTYFVSDLAQGNHDE